MVRLPMLSLALLLQGAPDASAFERPTPAQLQEAMTASDREDRLRRVQQLAPHRLSSALQGRAAYKVERESLRAKGISASEIGGVLFGGRRMAFPYAAQPELKSSGTVRTLTVLVDFKDYRASSLLPAFTPATVAANIYGQGTAIAASFKPYESARAYYTRASQGKLDLQGNVLGWHHFAKDRSSYEPIYAPGATDAQKSAADNQALFDIVREALAAQDATHDFAQYDNDGDGDIDLVTIIYAGPDTGWNSFWWAYRWHFDVDASWTTLFDKKRVHQFVFQFADRRGPQNKDFDPLTLIHEMGHGFGLADYYDYNEQVGPAGGVGGGDMMDANLGNHGAFSRWLLDWIDLDVITSAAPTERQLVASGAAANTNKAIAIFPSALNPAAPDQEVFIIENRFRTGNDGAGSGMPGDGLFIWHVDAHVNDKHNDFLYDNSFTPIKLVCLKRADNAGDFGPKERFDTATYFINGNAFTPDSTPSSQAHSGKRTGVVVRNISAPGPTMTATIGIESSATVGPAPVGPPLSDRARMMTSDIRSLLGVETTTPRVNLDALEALAAQVGNATPDELRAMWATVAPTSDRVSSRTASAALQLVLTGWAAKDGAGAAAAALALNDGELKQEVFPRVMETWAAGDPFNAKAWYFRAENEALRRSNTVSAGAPFAHRLFGWMAANDYDTAVASLDNLRNASEIWGALAALDTAAGGLSKEAIAAKLASVPRHRDVIRAYRDLGSVILTMQGAAGLSRPQDLLDLVGSHGALATSGATGPTKVPDL